MSKKIEKDARDVYDCCRHCGEGCGAENRHRMPCNSCQPRIVEKPA